MSSAFRFQTSRFSRNAICYRMFLAYRRHALMTFVEVVFSGVSVNWRFSVLVVYFQAELILFRFAVI